jgi:hypothetical protein
MTDDDRELAKLIATANPKSIARISKENLLGAKKSAKAVLFLPEGVDLNDSLDIEVVGLNAATMAAMAARRC